MDISLILRLVALAVNLFIVCAYGWLIYQDLKNPETFAEGLYRLRKAGLVVGLCLAIGGLMSVFTTPDSFMQRVSVVLTAAGFVIVGSILFWASSKR